MSPRVTPVSCVASPRGATCRETRLRSEIVRRGSCTVGRVACKGWLSWTLLLSSAVAMACDPEPPPDDDAGGTSSGAEAGAEATDEDDGAGSTPVMPVADECLRYSSEWVLPAAPCSGGASVSIDEDESGTEAAAARATPVLEALRDGVPGTYTVSVVESPENDWLVTVYVFFDRAAVAEIYASGEDFADMNAEVGRLRAPEFFEACLKDEELPFSCLRAAVEYACMTVDDLACE